MSANCHFGAIDISQRIHSINSRFGIGNQLFDKIVVWFGFAFADNGESRIVEHGVTARYPIHKRTIVRKGELIRISRALTCTVFVFIFGRIGPDKQRQFFCFCFKVITHRQVKCTRKFHTIGSFVFNHFFIYVLDAFERIGKMSNLCQHILLAEIAEVIIRIFVFRLNAHQCFAFLEIFDIENFFHFIRIS